MAVGRTNAGGGASGGIPEFTYTGNYTLIDDGARNWRIKFLGSGTFTPKKNITIDVCAVGGGGGGSRNPDAPSRGGCGGFTQNQMSIILLADEPYPVVVGAGGIGNTSTGGGNGGDGGESSAFGVEAYGGDGGLRWSPWYGGSGGASTGGSPGVDGANGTGADPVGVGQGTTTREFGEPTGFRYSDGGGLTASGTYAPLAANTGHGGWARTSAGLSGQNGASGIVVIRNHRAT
jgi:hypothetical protein